MSHLILQPAGHPEARSHYADTIEQPVSLERIRQHVTGDVLTELEQIYEGRGVPTWGVTPGQKSVTRKQWEKIVRGDVALFARAGEIFATAVVVIKAHCPELARELWGTDDNGQTWEYVYFLDEVQSCSIPYHTLNRCLDYKPNYVVRKFTVVEEEKSATAFTLLGLDSTTYYPPVTDTEYERAVTEPGANLPLDKETKTKTRTEQGYLRSKLFYGKQLETCALCGRDFPVEFLRASHIKKREQCSDEERRDWQNIVVPMCTFGCDELYERGYLGVEGGAIVVLRNSPANSVQAHLDLVEQRPCKYWSAARESYFTWHINSHKLRL